MQWQAKVKDARSPQGACKRQEGLLPGVLLEAEPCWQLGLAHLLSPKLRANKFIWSFSLWDIILLVLGSS